MNPIRLTELSHGGGCGCKIAPAVLSEILANLPKQFADPALLVGTESSDDAAVYRLNDQQAIIATTDFFMPIVDDAFDFGRIAATNALSDIYAMGGKPLFALAIVGMPIGKLPVETIREILAGGEAVCRAAGIPVAGGHSIDAPEPIYGLVGIGVADPKHVKRNDTAQAGDLLVLGKPLGIGIMSAALKKNALDGDGYAQMIASTTKLNTPGSEFAQLGEVHAMTDVTGFGLLGHLLEICRGSNLGAALRFAELPLWPAARALAEAGFAPGAVDRNWASYGDSIDLADSLSPWQKSLLCDPQTSGGLLVACAPQALEQVLAIFRSHGFDQAAQIGTLTQGSPRIRVDA